MIFQFARDAYYRTNIYNRMLRRHGPAQIYGLATDPIPGDPARGAGMLDGAMVLAARRRMLGDHIFENDLRSTAALTDLYGFSWLRDLSALSAPAASAWAAARIGDWLRHGDRWDALTWSPGVTGARLLAWFNYIDFVTTAGDSPLRADMAASAAAQLRHLANTVRAGKRQGRRPTRMPGDDGVTAGTALIAGSVAVSDMAPCLAAGLKCLEDALSHDLFSDGGHRSRSPETALRILARLTEVRLALQVARQPPPEFLADAMARLTSAVKATFLGDGTTAQFGGGTAVPSPVVSAILGAVGGRRGATPSLPDWGFERLHGGGTTVVADTGGPLAGLSGGNHAGALSFEMSAGRHRLVVNCGAHPDETTEWADVLGATAAHSTLSVNDTDALPSRVRGKAGREAVGMAVRRNEREGSTLVQMGHEGYRRSFGIIHNRDLYLSSAGDDFRGKDTLVGGAGAFTLRFHLHPDVGVSALSGGDAVLLKLPGGKGWRFRCDGARPAIEDSVYLGDPAAPRRTRQIVLRGDHRSGETVVRWSFLREGA